MRQVTASSFQLVKSNNGLSTNLIDASHFTFYCWIAGLVNLHIHITIDHPILHFSMKVADNCLYPRQTQLSHSHGPVQSLDAGHLLQE